MKKILIVEDDRALVTVLRDELGGHGFSASVAGDGEEALKKMRASQPDLVLLDLVMPVMDGFSVLEEMRGDDGLRDIPVVVLSNLGEDDDIKRALKLGALDYFVKAQHPIKEIAEKINQVLIKGEVRSKKR